MALQSKALLGLVPPGLYETPLAVSAAEVGFRGGKDRAHILLTLVGGYELDIPLTQDAVNRMALLLEPIRSKQK